MNLPQTIPTEWTNGELRQCLFAYDKIDIVLAMTREQMISLIFKFKEDAE